MFKVLCAFALLCSAMACNNRPAVPGEHCFTPTNAFLTDISEVCELGQKEDRACYLRYSNGSKGDIPCRQFDAMRSIGPGQ